MDKAPGLPCDRRFRAPAAEAAAVAVFILSFCLSTARCDIAIS